MTRATGIMIKNIGGDLTAYNVLLDRSLQYHISETLDFTDDPTLNDKTKAARINGRRQTLGMKYLKG